MAEDIAREIIAQSRGGSKLAFSFEASHCDVLLYMSKSKDENEKILYHVHKSRNDATQQYKEYNYSNLKGAMALVKTFTQSSYVTVKVVLYNNGIDCEEIGSLIDSAGPNIILTGLIEKMVSILDADVVNVTPM